MNSERHSDRNSTMWNVFFKTLDSCQSHAFVSGRPAEPSGWTEGLSHTHRVQTYESKYKTLEREGGRRLIAAVSG